MVTSAQVLFVATRNSNIDKRSYGAVAISLTCHRDGWRGSFQLLHVSDDSTHPKEEQRLKSLALGKTVRVITMMG